MNQEFLIWSFDHDGWWRPNENGYAEEMQQAGRYTLEQALSICTEANRSFHAGYSEMPNEAMIPAPSKESES